MSLRELLFAAVLLPCFVAVAYGVRLLSVPAGFIAGGVLFGVWAWLVLSE